MSFDTNLEPKTTEWESWAREVHICRKIEEACKDIAIKGMHSRFKEVLDTLWQHYDEVVPEKKSDREFYSQKTEELYGR